MALRASGRPGVLRAVVHVSVPHGLRPLHSDRRAHGQRRESGSVHRPALLAADRLRVVLSGAAGDAAAPRALAARRAARRVRGDALGLHLADADRLSVSRRRRRRRESDAAAAHDNAHVAHGFRCERPTGVHGFGLLLSRHGPQRAPDAGESGGARSAAAAGAERAVFEAAVLRAAVPFGPAVAYGVSEFWT